MASSSSRLVVEYAKSGRSTCKGCSGTILAKSPRLGMVTRDAQRGFDQTRWHHLHCFRQNVPSSTDHISGFDSLKSGDQEALRLILTQNNDATDKKRKTDDGETNIQTVKNVKITAEYDDVKVAFSLSDVMEKYKDAVLLPGWKAYQTVIFLDQSAVCSNKIAAFDFDGCLANTSVKIIGADAWSLMYPSIPEKIRLLHHDGYKLVIFTNEANIERWKYRRQAAVDSKLGRLSSFVKLADVPIQVFVACGYSHKNAEDPYRKPNTGMWQLMAAHFNSAASIDMDNSFYVGDAAGRPADHSDADIEFAKRIGLKFHLPEDFFCA